MKLETDEKLRKQSPVRVNQKSLILFMPKTKMEEGNLKTYLTFWFYSEGASPLEVVGKLRSMGFEPLRGYHDHVYDWGRKVELVEVLQLANKVHETLKGMKVFYKLETE